MKKIGLVLGMLILAATSAAGPCAAEPAAGPAAIKGEQKAEKKKTGTYLGEVMEVDLKANKMLVAPRNTSLAMVLNTSRVKNIAGYAGLGEVKAGDWVETTFEAKVGTMYALTVARAKKPEEPRGAVAKQKPAHHP